MLLIQDNKNTDFLMVYGDGEKAGVVRLWLLRDQEELEEQLMDTVIGFTLQLCMQTSWKNIQNQKSVNSHLKV